MSVSVSVCNLEGKKVSDMSFEPCVSNVGVTSYSLAVRVLRNNSRSFNSSTKTRGEVAMSGKKPWKQKGTGRARASSAKSPLWRGGGVTFGPTSDRNPRLSLNKKVSKGVYGALFNQVSQASGISGVDWAGIGVSTGKAASFLKQQNLQQDRIVVFVSDLSSDFALSFRNLLGVQLCPYNEYNVVALSSQSWLFAQEDAVLFKEMVGKWL